LQKNGNKQVKRNFGIGHQLLKQKHRQQQNASGTKKSTEINTAAIKPKYIAFTIKKIKNYILF
jgi:hypothetical protein